MLLSKEGKIIPHNYNFLHKCKIISNKWKFKIEKKLGILKKILPLYIVINISVDYRWLDHKC
jgi:hypothetical protein